MAKIPFTLEAWLKDKSQKVETRDGRLVHNIWRVKEPSYTNSRKAEVCALIDGEEDALVFFKGGRYLPTTKDTDSPFDLFIITPEPEFTEFEQEVRECVTKNLTTHIKDGNGREISSTVFIDDDTAKKMAVELIELARKELIEEQYTSDPRKTDLYKLGREEALKDLPRWEKTSNKGTYIDASNIVYHDGYYLGIKTLETLPGFKED